MYTIAELVCAWLVTCNTQWQCAQKCSISVSMGELRFKNGGHSLDDASTPELNLSWRWNFSKQMDMIKQDGAYLHYSTELAFCCFEFSLIRLRYLTARLFLSPCCCWWLEHPASSCFGVPLSWWSQFHFSSFVLCSTWHLFKLKWAVLILISWWNHSGNQDAACQYWASHHLLSWTGTSAVHIPCREHHRSHPAPSPLLNQKDTVTYLAGKEWYTAWQ